MKKTEKTAKKTVAKKTTDKPVSAETVKTEAVKTEAVLAETAKTEAKAADAKAEAKGTDVKAETKDTAAKAATKAKAKAETKETPAKTAAKPKAATKPAAKAITQEITLQVNGREDLSMDALINKVKAAYAAEGHSADSIQTVAVYIKLSENMAYYVINKGQQDEYASGTQLY